MKKMLSRIAALAAAGTLLLAASGCTTAAATPAATGLRVAATTTQLQDFVQQIGGSKVQLTGLLKPGASAHSFDPSPADLKALAQADILVVNGAGLDDFINSAITASGFDGTVVVAADGVDLAAAAAITSEFRKNSTAGTHDHTDHNEHHDTNHGARGSGNSTAHGDAHGDHSHGNGAEVDPHIWTSVRFAHAMLQPIAAALATADPANAEFYHSNSSAYGVKLATLHDWLSEEFGQVDSSRKKFVSTHNALLYFLHDYNIEFVGSVIPSFEDNAEPSAAELATLVANIKKTQVPAIFVESSNSPRLNSTVAKEAGIPVITEPLYADSLAVSGPASSYIGATISNARTMLTAWGHEPGATPSALQ